MNSLTAYFGHVWIARLLLQRGMAAIYLVAFISVVRQFKPLLGERGLPARPRVSATRNLPRSSQHLPLALHRPPARSRRLDRSPHLRLRPFRTHRSRPTLAVRRCMASTLDALSLHHECWSNLLRLRLGVDAARSRLLHRLPRSGAYATVANPRPRPALDAVPDRTRRGPHQAAPRLLLARPHLPLLSLRNPTPPQPLKLVLPPSAPGLASLRSALQSLRAARRSFWSLCSTAIRGRRRGTHDRCSNSGSSSAAIIRGSTCSPPCSASPASATAYCRVAIPIHAPPLSSRPLTFDISPLRPRGRGNRSGSASNPSETSSPDTSS